MSTLSELNSEQQAAAQHRGGALLVIAGAGSGKTLTLAARVARLVLDGADPQRLLLMTFSRRAAAEMGRRVGHLLHEALRLSALLPAPTLPWCGTFHGMAARLLREMAPRIGLAPQFGLLDRADAQDLMAMTRQSLGLASTHHRFPLAATCLAIHSRAVNAAQPLADLLAHDYPWVASCEEGLQRLFAAYAAEKRRQHLLDYDDLLLMWWHLMRSPLGAEVAARFDQVLVDEYQDTNRLQADILLALQPTGQGLTVVGDDAQAIYAFRAAEVRNILDFPQRFSPAATVLTLTRNYRSTQPILAASNAVIALAAERYAKYLWSERESSARPRLVTVEDEAAQARWVADEVLRQREEGLVLKRQAVLFRTAHHSAALELELARRNIPFVKFGGLKFFESAHVKDVLALLRWADNPRCRLAGFRAARLLPGLGAASVGRLLDAMDAAADPAAELERFKPPAAAALPFAALRTTFAALTGPGGGWPHDLQQAIDWYQPHLERLHDDARLRRADLDQLACIAAAHGSRERFLTELALDPPQASSDESGAPHRDEDYLILSTIHSAKGQEWNAVSVLNVVDGCMPADMATGSSAEIEEERRLLYVAMTRARDSLNLLVPQRFYVTQQRAWGDRHLYATLSRFIPPEVAALFESSAPGTGDEAIRAAGGPAVVDLAELIRSRWA